MMPEWIAKVDEIDKHLHTIGVPDAQRMRAIGEIATILARAEVAKKRADREKEAARLLHLGAEVVAQRQDCHRSTAYRRAARAKIVATSAT